MEIDFTRPCDCWLDVGRCRCRYIKDEMSIISFKSNNKDFKVGKIGRVDYRIPLRKPDVPMFNTKTKEFWVESMGGQRLKFAKGDKFILNKSQEERLFKELERRLESNEQK